MTYKLNSKLDIDSHFEHFQIFAKAPVRFNKYTQELSISASLEE